MKKVLIESGIAAQVSSCVRLGNPGVKWPWIKDADGRVGFALDGHEPMYLRVVATGFAEVEFSSGSGGSRSSMIFSPGTEIIEVPGDIIYARLVSKVLLDGDCVPVTPDGPEVFISKAGIKWVEEE